MLVSRRWRITVSVEGSNNGQLSDSDVPHAAPHYLEPAPVVEIRGIRSSAADPEQLAMSITLIDSKTGFE